MHYQEFDVHICTQRQRLTDAAEQLWLAQQAESSPNRYALALLGQCLVGIGSWLHTRYGGTDQLPTPLTATLPETLHCSY